MVLAGVIGLLSIGLLSSLRAEPMPPVPLFPYISKNLFEPDSNGVDSLVQLVPTASLFQKNILKSSSPTIVKFFTESGKNVSGQRQWFQALASEFGSRVSCCAINLEKSRGLLSPLMALGMNVQHSMHHGGAQAKKFSQIVKHILSQLKLCAAKSYSSVQPFYLLFKEGQLIVPTVFGPQEHDASMRLLEKYAQKQRLSDSIAVLSDSNDSEFLGLSKKLEELIIRRDLVPRGSFLHAHTLVVPGAQKKLGLL